MLKIWFKTSNSSQEVGEIISNNWLDMGLYLIWCAEKKKHFLVAEDEITGFVPISPYFQWNGKTIIKNEKQKFTTLR